MLPPLPTLPAVDTKKGQGVQQHPPPGGTVPPDSEFNGGFMARYHVELKRRKESSLSTKTWWEVVEASSEEMAKQIAEDKAKFQYPGELIVVNRIKSS